VDIKRLLAEIKPLDRPLHAIKGKPLYKRVHREDSPEYKAKIKAYQKEYRSKPEHKEYKLRWHREHFGSVPMSIYHRTTKKYLKQHQYYLEHKSEYKVRRQQQTRRQQQK
jgi:hypothetical protein